SICSFFFSSRRRHTRLQGDWSSDVCSSDLDLLDDRFGFADREIARDDVARGAALIGLVAERQQRARVAHRQASRRHLAPQLVGRSEERRVGEGGRRGGGGGRWGASESRVVV